MALRVNSLAAFFNCTTAGRAADSIAAQSQILSRQPFAKHYSFVVGFMVVPMVFFFFFLWLLFCRLTLIFHLVEIFICFSVLIR